MTRRKTAMFAVFSAALCLILCGSMLLNGTFAWFTDNVTNENNRIIAGNLDIEMECSMNLTDWADVTSVQDVFVTPDGVTKGCWEPGHTEIAYLKITNAGTLSLKYQLEVSPVDETIGKNAEGGDIKLSEILKFTAAGPSATAPEAYTRETALAAVMAAANSVNLTEYATNVITLAPGAVQYVALLVYMPVEVGNEANYRGDAVPTINFGLTLYATQVEAENDSFGNDYDADLPVKVSPVSMNGVSYDTLADAVAAIEAGDTVAITLNESFEDTRFAVPANANVTLDLNGNHLSFTKGSVTVTDHNGAEKKVWTAIGVSAGATLTMKNGDVAYTTGDTGLISNYGILNLEGGTYSVSDSTSSAPMVLMNQTGGVVNATGVTFENACKAVAINNDGEMILTNCVIKQTNASAVDGAAIDNNNKLTLVNCTVSNAKPNYQLIGQHKSAACTTIESGSYTSTGKLFVTTGTYVVNGGTFNANPSGTNVTVNGTLTQNTDGTWTVQ